MKIAVDFSPVENSPAGIGQYTINLVSKLIEIAPENKYFIYSTKSFLLNNTENIVIKKSNLPGSGIGWMRQVAKSSKENKTDVLISPSNHLLSLFFPKTIQFIHDLAPIKFPGSVSLKFSLIFRITSKLALKKAWKIATISETVKQELLDYSKQKRQDILVITPAINKWIHEDPKNSEEVIEKYNLPGRYILALSTLQPRKNFENIILGFLEYQKKEKNDIKLVIVGQTGWKTKRIQSLIDNPETKNLISSLGYVPNNELSALFKNAQLYINLSFYEGFGIPPLEALAFDIPVLLSDIPVFKESFKGLAVFVDPVNINLIAEKIKSSLKLKKKTAEIVRNQFSWDKSAKTLLDSIYEGD